MRADRAIAGLSGAALSVAVGFAPGELGVREIVFLALAGVVLLGAFAPKLPILHKCRKIGAPRVSAALSFEALEEDGSEDLVVTHVGGEATPRVLRVGLVNKGPGLVREALVNVFVDAGVEIVASDYRGDPSIGHGKAMPRTRVDGRPMRFWADEVSIPKEARLLNYRLSFPAVRDLGSEFSIRVQYDADDLYGGERTEERKVRVVDLSDTMEDQ
jgi:hypothetical protein